MPDYALFCSRRHCEFSHNEGQLTLHAKETCLSETIFRYPRCTPFNLQIAPVATLQYSPRLLQVEEIMTTLHHSPRLLGPHLPQVGENVNEGVTALRYSPRLLGPTL